MIKVILYYEDNTLDYIDPPLKNETYELKKIN